MIWLASILVPSEQRIPWRNRRVLKTWHWSHFLASSGNLNAANRRELLRFSWNSFGEAFWIRFDRMEFFARLGKIRRSPRTPLTIFSVLLIGALLVGGFIPAILSNVLDPVRQPDRVSLITFDAQFRRMRSDTLLDLAEIWSKSDKLDGVAAYSWQPVRFGDVLSTAQGRAAQVAPNFFQLLGVNAALGRTFVPDDVRNCRNCVLLSDETWREMFHSSHDVLGSSIVVDGSTQRIIGVLPRNFHLVSSGIAVWSLLDPRTADFTNFIDRVGLVARLRGNSTAPKLEPILTNLAENAGYRLAPLQVTSVRQAYQYTIRVYAFLMLLAVVSAAGIVYLRSPRTLAGQPPMNAAARLRWWGFYVAKSSLLLGAVLLITWSLVHRVSAYVMGVGYPLADEIAVWVFLPLAVGALTWSIFDQQQRCRVCLRRLGMAVDIGRLGAVLLSHSGTEMVCPEGHGILYLAESDANWLERDRWSNLDDSWADLFDDK